MVSNQPCGKKKPDNQKDFGRPVFIQLSMNEQRNVKSFTHEPSGFSDGYAAFAHNEGTWLFKNAL